MLELGRRIDKHDDGEAIGYVEVDASNVVVAFELINCILALELMADNDEDGLDANDVVELDTFVAVEFAVMAVVVLVAAAVATAVVTPLLLLLTCSPVALPLFSSGN